MAHEDNIPEPTEDDDHYVHLHIDFADEPMNEDGTPAEYAMGVVHMHVHGVPTSNFVETLLMLAVQVTASAMLQGADDGENMTNPLSLVPREMRGEAVDKFARMFLANKIMHTESQAIVSQVPDDASSLIDGD